MKQIRSYNVIQRQLPQHVRDSFPLFVEFIKSYYKFLDNSQQTLVDQVPDITDKELDEFNNTIILEKIRDVDTSLDVFISQFKKEFSENVPIDKAQDPRQLIKHMKEFYLSRGSEASYKFLFKTLFDKDVSIFYPSTQILRVSDGKWQQDISIFVSVKEGLPSLFPLNGNYITISTTRNVNGRNITKRVTTYVNRVVQYASGTFELYIQRDYINEIDIGSIVSYEADGVTYLATVLPCPSKLSIYKPGKGFKVGQLYSLQTQIGRGCLIKITKVGSQGEIKDIQLIQIGLDYQTTFYSYLSSKDFIPSEYVNPAVVHPDGSPPTVTNPYNERLGGFTDYGFASKQTYFDYDATIPVETSDKASDRFFADPSYVGDLDAQFFAEDTDNPIDSDLAIIQINLGAVAKYPGYYMTQDGFISDEMYIQDGSYYQAYSYVLRVDEELRRYSDLVKKILHPAGLKFFAEYNITTEIKFEQALQALRKVVDRINTVNVLDQGFNYSSYIVDDEAPELAYIPAPGAQKVFSKFGAPALFNSKKFTTDSVTQPDKQAKTVNKPLTDSVNTPVDVTTKHVFKALSHAVGLADAGFSYDKYITSIVSGNPVVTPDPTANVVFSSKPTLAVSKRITETVNQIEAIAKAYNKSLSDDITLSEFIAKLYGKNLTETIVLTDEQAKIVNKPLVELVTLSETVGKDFVKPLTDLLVVLEFVSKTVVKPFEDSVSNTDALVNAVSKLVVDTLSTIDQLQSLDTTKTINELVLPQDILVESFDKTIADVINSLDALGISFERSFADENTVTDSSVLGFGKNLSEAIITASAINNKDLAKSLTESVTLLEQISKGIIKPFEDFVTLSDFVVVLRTLLYGDIVQVLDSNSKNASKQFSDTQSVTDSQSKVLQPTKNESINILTSGYVVLNPFDLETYSSPEDQYTANTPIT